MSDQRVLVVGGGQGIGEHVTEYLVKSHGARAVVLSLHVTGNIQRMETDGLIRIVRGDATQPEVQQRAYDEVRGYLGGLDALVVTLGVIGEIETVSRLDVGLMRTTFDVNYFAPVQLTQLFLPFLRQSSGRVVILSSAADRDVTWSGWAPYSTSKAALTRFIEVLGHEEDRVKVFGMYPGLTRTPMVTDLIAGKFQGKMKDTEVDEFKRRDREGEVEPPEWSANAAAKLAAGTVGGDGEGKVMWYYDLDSDYRSGLEGP